VILSPGEHGIW